MNESSPEARTEIRRLANLVLRDLDAAEQNERSGYNDHAAYDWRGMSESAAQLHLMLNAQRVRLGMEAIRL